MQNEIFQIELWSMTLRPYVKQQKKWFSVLSTVFEHDRVASSMQKNLRARDAVECSDVLGSAENNPGVLYNSTEHTEALTLRQPLSTLHICFYEKVQNKVNPYTEIFYFKVNIKYKNH